MLAEIAPWLRSFSSGSSLRALLELSNDQAGQRKRLLCGLHSIDISNKQLTCVIRLPVGNNAASSSEKLYIMLHSMYSITSDNIDYSSHESEQQQANELIQQMTSQHNLCFLSCDKILCTIDLTFLFVSNSPGCILYGLAKGDGWLHIFMRTLTSAWSILTKLQLLVREENNIAYELLNVWIDEERHDLIWWQSSGEHHAVYSCSLDLTNSNDSCTSSNSNYPSSMQQQIEVSMSPFVLLWKQGCSIAVIQHVSSSNDDHTITNNNIAQRQSLLWIITSNSSSIITATVIDLKSGQQYSHLLPHDATNNSSQETGNIDFLPDFSSSQQRCGVKIIVYSRRLYLCHLPRDSNRRSLKLFRIRSSTSCTLSDATAAIIATSSLERKSKNNVSLVLYLLVLSTRTQVEIHRVTLHPSSHNTDKGKAIKTELVTTIRIPRHSLSDQLQFITGNFSHLVVSTTAMKSVVSMPIIFTRPTNKLISLQLSVPQTNIEKEGEGYTFMFSALEALYNNKGEKSEDGEYTLTLPEKSGPKNLMKALDLLKTFNNSNNATISSEERKSSGVVEHAGQFFFDLTKQSGCWEEKFILSSSSTFLLATDASHKTCYIRWHQRLQEKEAAASTATARSVWEQRVNEADTWMPRQYQQFIHIDHIQLQRFARDNDLIFRSRSDNECDLRKMTVEEDEQESRFLLDIFAHICTSTIDKSQRDEGNIDCEVIEVDLITLRPSTESNEEADTFTQIDMEHLDRIFTPEALLMILSYTFSTSIYFPNVNDDNGISGDVEQAEADLPPTALKQFVNPIQTMILHQLLHDPQDLPTLLSSLLLAQQSIIRQEDDHHSTRQRHDNRSHSYSGGESSTPWSVLQSVPSQEFIYDSRPPPYQAEMVVSSRPVDQRRKTEDEKDALEDIFGLALFDQKKSNLHDDEFDNNSNISASSVHGISPRPTKQHIIHELQPRRQAERAFDLTDLLSFFTSGYDKVPRLQQPQPSRQRQLWQALTEETPRSRSDSRLSQLHSSDQQDEYDTDDEYSDEHYFRRIIGNSLLHALRLHFQAKLTIAEENKSPFAHLFRDIDSDPQQRRVLYHLLLMVDRPIAAARLMLIWHDHLAYDRLKQRLQASADVTNALTLIKQKHYRPELDASIIEYYLQVQVRNGGHEKERQKLQEYLLGPTVATGQRADSRLIKKLNPLFERPWSDDEIEEELEIWKQEADRGLTEKRKQQLGAINEATQTSLSFV